jgi:hypothetical protein
MAELKVTYKDLPDFLQRGYRGRERRPRARAAFRPADTPVRNSEAVA